MAWGIQAPGSKEWDSEDEESVGGVAVYPSCGSGLTTKSREESRDEMEDGSANI